MKPLTALLTFIISCGVASAPRANPTVRFRLRESKSRAEIVNKTPAPNDLRIGIISYWDPPTSPDWDRVPPDSLVVINPNDGILEADLSVKGKPKWKTVSDAAEWAKLVARLQKKNVQVLGYVPTGYFNHGPCELQPTPKCQMKEWMRLQVETYYKIIPALNGIFFDETSPSADDEAKANYDKEYAMLRALNNPGRITVFNVGWSSARAIAAAKSGEQLVLYESAPGSYETDATSITTMTRKARDKGIIVWHLLHTVTDADAMCSYVKEMAKRGANYGYVTNLRDHTTGDNTWGSLPPYWTEELQAFSNLGKPCPQN